MFHCSSTCKKCACLVEAALELCASVEKCCGSFGFLAGSLWVHGDSCGIIEVCFGMPEQVAWKELQGMDVLFPKQTHTSLAEVFRGAQKEATRSHKQIHKGTTRNPQENYNPQKNQPEKNKHVIVRTSARVKPRSLVASTSQVLSGQAQCASKRQLRQRMFDSTDQDKANTFSISTRSCRM